MKFIESAFKTTKLSQQETNEKNVAILTAGLADTPKAFKYVLNIKNSDEPVVNTLKLVYKLPTNTLSATNDLVKSFGGAKNLPVGLLRSGLLENLAEIKPDQTKNIIKEVLRSETVQGSKVRDINQDSINSLLDKTVEVMRVLKGQNNSLKAIGNLLADVAEANTAERASVMAKGLGTLYSSVKDPAAQTAVHNLIEQSAKTFTDPAMLDIITNKVSANPNISKLLPDSESGKKKLVSSVINYTSEITQALLPKQKETGHLVSLFNKFQQTKTTDNPTKEEKQMRNKALSNLLTSSIELLKDPKIMAINSKFLESNKHEIAAIIDKKLDEKRAQSQAKGGPPTWKEWFADKALSKINGDFCVKFLQEANTPKALEAVDRLIQKPSFINGIRVAIATKNVGLLTKTLIFGVAKEKTLPSRQMKESPKFNPELMRKEHKSDTKIMTSMPANKTKPTQMTR